MDTKESISNSVDFLIGSTIKTINSVYSTSLGQFEELQNMFDDIKNDSGNNLIPEDAKKTKIQNYLTLSKNFNENISLIYTDIEKKLAFFKSEAAEEK